MTEMDWAVIGGFGVFFIGFVLFTLSRGPDSEMSAPKPPLDRQPWAADKRRKRTRYASLTAAPANAFWLPREGYEQDPTDYPAWVTQEEG